MSATQKPVPGFPAYLVTDTGEFIHRRFRRQKKISYTKKHGYPYLRLRLAGENVCVYPQKLVALAFVPGRTKTKNQVLYKDGNRKNIAAHNLYWGTLREAHQAGLTGRNLKQGLRGEKNPLSKLTPQKVKALLRQYATGRTSYRLLAAKYGISDMAVYKIVKRKTWAHLTVPAT